MTDKIRWRLVLRGQQSSGLTVVLVSFPLFLISLRSQSSATGARNKPNFIKRKKAQMPFIVLNLCFTVGCCVVF